MNLTINNYIESEIQKYKNIKIFIVINLIIVTFIILTLFLLCCNIYFEYKKINNNDNIIDASINLLKTIPISDKWLNLITNYVTEKYYEKLLKKINDEIQIKFLYDYYMILLSYNKIIDYYTLVNKDNNNEDKVTYNYFINETYKNIENYNNDDDIKIVNTIYIAIIKLFTELHLNNMQKSFENILKHESKLYISGYFDQFEHIEANITKSIIQNYQITKIKHYNGVLTLITNSLKKIYTTIDFYDIYPLLLEYNYFKFDNDERFDNEENIDRKKGYINDIYSKIIVKCIKFLITINNKLTNNVMRKLFSNEYSESKYKYYVSNLLKSMQKYFIEKHMIIIPNFNNINKNIINRQNNPFYNYRIDYCENNDLVDSFKKNNNYVISNLFNKN